jgi:hypothetical protein
MKFTVVESFDVEKAIMDPGCYSTPQNVDVLRTCTILNTLMWDIDHKTKEYHIDWDCDRVGFIVLSAKYKTLYHFNHDEVPKVVRDALSRINKDTIHINGESWAVIDEGKTKEALKAKFEGVDK